MSHVYFLLFLYICSFYIQLVWWSSILIPELITVAVFVGPLDLCIDAKLQSMQDAIEHFDVVRPVKNNHDATYSNYLPFIGKYTAESKLYKFIFLSKYLNINVD